MNDEKNKKDRVEKLIRFFKSLKVKKPACDQPDYSSWNQTEEEYQKQQADWMAGIEERKKKREKTGE